MVTNIEKLNKKEIQNFIKILDDQYELNFKKPKKEITTYRFATDFIIEDKIFNFKYFSLYKTNKNRYYLTNKDVDNIDTRRINLVNVGIYLGEMLQNYFRPSVELTHIITPFINKNKLILEKKNAIEFLNGFDLFIDKIQNSYKDNNFIIVLYKNNPLGIVKKNSDRFSNLLSKGRRIESNDIPDL